MSRINNPVDAHTPAASKPLLEAVNKQLGMVPNLMKVVSHSPAALEGYLSLNGALARGALDAPLRERIALAVAEANQCGYCAAAHAYLGAHVAKLSQAEIDAARDGRSADPRADAALHFARRVLAERGRVTDQDFASLRAAGFGDGEVIEVVLNVALNVLTNYVNNVAQTVVDFPAIQARA